MKKYLGILVGLVLLASTVNAEIQIKDLGNGKVELTFLYQDDKATEMSVIGSFDNWTAPGEAMAKNGAGIWEKTMTVGPADELVYKFYSKGTWIFDEMAPDKKDDGYGGNNGLVVVADILSGVTPMSPGAAPVVAKAGPKPKAGRPKVAFGTETHVGSSTEIATTGGAFTPTVSTIEARSIWRFQGDLIPNMPAHLELTAFSGSPKIYDRSTLGWDTGLQNLGSGLGFTPFYYLGGGVRPKLDQFKFGFDTPLLAYETGYGASAMAGRKSVLWSTVSDTLPANGGFSTLRLGTSLRNLDDWQLDGFVTTNRMLTDFYGLLAGFSVGTSMFRIDGQYNMRSTTKTDPTLWFVNPGRQDFLGGASYAGDGLSIKVQGLLSRFAAGSATDATPLLDRLAVEAELGLSDYYDDSAIFLSGGVRGWAAQNLYLSLAENDSSLGALVNKTSSTGTVLLSAGSPITVNTIYGGVRSFLKFEYWGRADGNLRVSMPTANPTSGNVKVFFDPGFSVDFGKLISLPLRVNASASVIYSTLPDTAAGVTAFAIPGARVKATFDTPLPGIVSSAGVEYLAELSKPSLGLHSLLGDVLLGGGWDLQAGVGLRTGSSVASPFGAILGASWAVPAVELRTPIAYAQLAVGMDPWGNNAGGSAPVDYRIENGASVMDGKAALRLGISWQY